MKQVTILVYRAELANGNACYAASISEWNFFGLSESLKQIALVVVTEIVMLKESDGCQFSIDCFPLHYIEMKPNFMLHRCLPLTSGEQDEFWKYFVDMRSK